MRITAYRIAKGSVRTLYSNPKPYVYIRYIYLYIEAEFHDIAVFNNVFFSFNT